MSSPNCSNLDNDFISDILPREFPNFRLADGITSYRLDKSASHYRMDGCRRGVAAIFNQALPVCCKENERKYVHCDVTSLTKTFAKLGFDIEIFNELTFREVENTLEDLSQRDHTDCDCIVVVYLSRGIGNGGRLRARDAFFNVNCLWGCFTAEQSPTLANKPKVYIVYTYKEYSRSEKKQCSLSVDCASTEDNCSGSDKLRSYFIPDRADFLITLSTVEGRNPLSLGSLYIQTLCQHLDRLGFDQDILTILTEVNNKILQLIGNPSQCIGNGGKKRLPIIISLLIRILQFTKNKEGSSIKKRKKAFNFEEVSEEGCEEVVENSVSRKISYKRKKIYK